MAHDDDVVSGDLPGPDATDVPAGTPDEGPDELRDRAADPVAAELGAIFAAALADEPESAVTPLSVLHAVRGERGRRSDTHWRREWALWKWGGGLAAAAAAIVAVIVGAAYFGTHGVADTTAAGSSAGSAAALAAGSAPADAAGGAAASEQYGAETGAETGAESGAASDQSGSEFGTESAPSPQIAAGAPNDQAVAADASGDAAGAAADTSVAASEPPDDTGRGSLPPLSAAEVHALQTAFPQGAVRDTAVSAGGLPNAVRGSLVSTPWRDVELQVIVYDWSHGAPTIPGSAWRAISGANGLNVVVQELGSGDTPPVGIDQLRAIADAVAAALR